MFLQYNCMLLNHIIVIAFVRSNYYSITSELRYLNRNIFKGKKGKCIFDQIFQQEI